MHQTGLDMTTTNKFPVLGQVTTGFEPVRAVFEENFTKRGDVGAAVHVTLNGETIIDLWGGAADVAGKNLWTADTLVNVWSTTKGWLALAMHMLADRGLLDFEAPVAHYWPEFARHGKSAVLVKHVLLHTSGLPAPSMKVPDEALYHWEDMIQYLEQSTLFWQPGTQAGYHAGTFGWLNGEVLRRITGMSVGDFLRSQIAQPLAADTFIGLTSHEQARTAETIPPHPLMRLLLRAMMLTGSSVKAKALRNPPRPPEAVNTSRWREAQIPSSNGHASARGLARLYTALALGGTLNGVRLLSETAVEQAYREQFHGKDSVIGTDVRRSLGFMLPELGTDDPRSASAFGHPGQGGSIGFADPQKRLAMGYVMNRMVFGPDRRWLELCRAVYTCLDQR